MSGFCKAGRVDVAFWATIGAILDRHFSDGTSMLDFWFGLWAGMNHTKNFEQPPRV